MPRSIILTLLISLCFAGHAAFAQESIPEKEKRLNEVTGMDRLVLLEELTAYYSDVDLRKARKYGRQANNLTNNFLSSSNNFNTTEIALIINTKLLYGEVLMLRQDYLDAQNVFESSRDGAINYDYYIGEQEANFKLALIDSLINAGAVKQNFLKKALSDIDVGSAFSNSSNSMATASEIKLAQMAEKRGDTTAAVTHYTKARDLLNNRGQFKEADEIDDKLLTYREMRSIASIKEQLGEPEDARLPQPKLDHRIAIDSTGSFVLVKVDTMIYEEEQGTLEELKNLAQSSEERQDFEASLNYYKQYLSLQQKYQQDSVLRVGTAALVESEMKRLELKNRSTDANIIMIQQEKEAEVQLKNLVLAIALLIALAAFFILFMYISKRKKHNQLTTAFDELDQAKDKLEVAERHISNLLNQQVSPEIASALIQEKPERKRQYVAVMFVDIRGFTPMAEQMDPEQLIEYQNNVFGFMIDIIQKRNGNINQFMGDGFMATFGAPVSHGNDPKNAYLAGIDILKGLKKLNADKVIPETTLGIGIHAGFVVSGNVGTESRKQFSVTGNTVIIAARVEQLNKTYGAQMIITEEVFRCLSEQEQQKDLERHEVTIKGRTKAVKIMIVDKTQVAK